MMHAIAAVRECPQCIRTHSHAVPVIVLEATNTTDNRTATPQRAQQTLYAELRRVRDNNATTTTATKTKSRARVRIRSACRLDKPTRSDIFMRLLHPNAFALRDAPRCDEMMSRAAMAHATEQTSRGGQTPAGATSARHLCNDERTRALNIIVHVNTEIHLLLCATAMFC